MFKKYKSRDLNIFHFVFKKFNKIIFANYDNEL